MKRIVKNLITLCLIAMLSAGSMLPLYATAAPADTTVYVTNTGAKYHSSGCRYLKKSSNAISLEDAVNSGYTPCKVCSPATLTQSAPAKTTTTATTATTSTVQTTTSAVQDTTAPAFDAAFYAAAYPDVVNAYGTDPSILYQHYILYGAKEGRFPTLEAYTAAVTAAQAVK